MIAAAGSGVRLGAGGPKALQPVGGVAMLTRAVRAFADSGVVDRVVIAAPPEELEKVRKLSAGVGIGVTVIAGGVYRSDSVRLALDELADDVEGVLVHDAARPLAPPELFVAVARALLAGADAVVPALALVDTVKQVDEAGRVLCTLDRSRLRAVQTPQGFRAELLRRAHRSPAGGAAPAATDDAAPATDDAALVEAIGGCVLTVPGHPEAFKITTPLDLLLAEACLARRTEEGGGRVG